MNCQIKCHSAGEGSKDGHSSIIEAKDFIKHNKSVEETKKSGRYQAPFLAELELIWKLQEAKLEDVVELRRLVQYMCTPVYAFLWMNILELIYIKRMSKLVHLYVPETLSKKAIST